MMRQVSKDYAEFCDAFEGCSLKAYKDSGGVVTIGRGHVSDAEYPIDINTVYTKEQAEQVWLHDLKEATTLANSWLNNPFALTDHMFDVTVDLIFNAGKTRTYLQMLNEGNYQGARDQILRWIYDNGIVQIGLVKRCFARYMYFKDEPYSQFVTCNATSRNTKPLNDLINPLGYKLIFDSKTKFRLQRIN